MAVQNPPFALQAGSHSAELFRRAVNAEATYPGVLGQADVQVVANGTPNMTVNVGAGKALVLGTETTTQGMYYVFNDAVVNMAIAAADPTNPRRDLVVLRIQDAQYSGATNAASIQVITGTPAASPVDPAIPADSMVLARIAVAANAASIVAGNITDLRSFATWGTADGYNRQTFGAAATVHVVGAVRNQDGTYTAKAASANVFEQINAGFNWYTDSGLTAGNVFTRTLRMSLDLNGVLTVGMPAGGTTHEANRVQNLPQVYNRGFAWAADAATHQGGVSAGLSISVGRTDPAASFNNTATASPIIQGWHGATKQFEVLSNGHVTAWNADLQTVGVGGVPRLYIKATDAAADGKVWDFLPVSGDLVFRTINDAENASSTWLTARRVGNTVSMATFGVPIGAPSMAAAAVTTPPATGGNLFFDSTSGALRWKDQAGNLHTVTFTTP